jgi:ATP-dependent Lhr-like helicase
MPKRPQPASIPKPVDTSQALQLFHPAVQEWFSAVFASPTRPQIAGWPPIARGESTLILAPTGTGKTLAAFLWCINRMMFTPVPRRSSVAALSTSLPIKALAVDVERNLRAPLVGIAQAAQRQQAEFHMPASFHPYRRHASRRARPLLSVIPPIF